MRKYFCLLSWAALAILASTSSYAVVGGQESGPIFEKAAPHSVALQINYRDEDGSIHFKKGSAVLIAPDTLLSAGHNSHRSEIIDIEAIFSSMPCWGVNICGEQRITILRKIFHPNYKDPSEEGVFAPPSNDLVILKLAKQAPSSFRPIELIKRQPKKRGVIISGFGMSQDFEGASELADFRLRVSHLQLSDDSFLGQRAQFKTDQTYRGACGGDSGSPAFAENGSGLRLIGIFSRVGLTPEGKMSCLTKGFYSDVLYFRAWIKSFQE